MTNIIYQVRNIDHTDGACLTMSKLKSSKTLKTHKCSKHSKNQIIFLTQQAELRRDEFCLGYDETLKVVTTFTCQSKHKNKNRVSLM